MANAKISELIQRAPDGTEFLEVIIPPFGPGSNRRVLLQDIVDLAAGVGGTVTSVSGTTNRITSTGGATPVIDIDPAYDAAITSALALKAPLAGSKVIGFAVSDEVTPITTGNGKISFRMPYAMTLTAVRASLVTAQASGSIFTIDINESGTTILSTKLTINNTETTSVTAATPPVISDTALADNAVITVDIDQVGNGSAAGLKIWLIGS